MASTSDPSTALAMKQASLLRAHGSLLALLFAGVCYGIAISLAASYFRRSARQKKEPIFVRVYVASIVAGGAAFLAIQAAMMYQLLTALMSTAPPPLNARPTIAQTLENWVVPFFALGVEAYYVYRAVHVTKHRILQALAISLGFAALVGFLGFAVVNTQIRFGAAIPPKQALTYIFSACWAFALDGLVCASILVYELVYKRRATNVKSSLVQQFAEVALRSSGLVVVMLISTAVVVTLAYVSENPVYVQTSVAISRIFPFISCCIVLTCLLERPSLNDSYTDPTLTFGSTLDAVTASRQPRPSTQVFAVTVLPTDDDEESSPMDEKGEGGGGIGKLDLSYSATGSSRSSRSSWLRDGGREAR